MSENLGVKIDMTEQFSLIGKYVVNFENIVDQIRFSLSTLFQLQGLKIWEMSNIVFSQKQLTAEPLISCFQHIVNEVLKSDENSKELLKKVNNFCKKFRYEIQDRNDFLHGTFRFSEIYYVPDESYIIEDDFYVTKGSPSKEGANLKIVARKKEDIINHLKILDELYIEFSDLKVQVFIKFGDIKK